MSDSAPPASRPADALLGYPAIAAAMALWSSWGLFVRWLPIPPWALAGYVGAFACAGLAVAHLLRGRPARELWPREHRRGLLAMGLLFVANNVCFLSAYAKTSVANAVLTHYTAPVFVAVLAPLVLGERVLRSMPVALGLAAGGMLLLLPGVDLSPGDRNLQGLALGTASGVCYAGLIVLARHLSLRVFALPLLFFQNLVVAAALLPFSLAAGRGAPPWVWPVLALLGLVHAGGGGLLYVFGIRRVPAQAAAVLGYLEPVGAVALGALLLGERPGALGLAGGGLILAGGALVMWDERRRYKPVDAPLRRR